MNETIKKIIADFNFKRCLKYLENENDKFGGFYTDYKINSMILDAIGLLEKILLSNKEIDIIQDNFFIATKKNKQIDLHFSIYNTGEEIK